MASNALQVLYSAIDMIIVGNYVGKEALSAVSISSQIVNFATMVCLGFSNAGQVMVAQALGAKKKKEMNDIIGTLFGFVLALAIVISGVILVARVGILKLINTLNNKKDINGILVQLPVPKHINEETIINVIDPKKDVDAFHPVNVGKIMVGNFDFVPCTPAGVMELIKESGIDVAGKECVVVGRSNIVGKPQAMLLLHKNGTVTICHSRTKDLKEKTKQADILVAAVGIPNFITGDMIKEGAVVIDVGINRVADKKLVGDVEFESAEKVASAITPVPGGVGPMTIAMLMKNTVKAAIIQND